MAYGQYRLQFLHISDLHAKGPQEKEPWRRRRVLGDAWRRNLETLLEEEGTIHFVFFTGDAAQSGKSKSAPEAARDALSILSQGEPANLAPIARRWLAQRYLLTPGDRLSVPVFGAWIGHHALV